MTKNQTGAIFAVLLLAFRLQAETGISLPGRSLVKLTADLQRPYVYGLNPGDGSSNGTLLKFSTTNGSLLLSEINVSTNPTDMAINPTGDALYVINAGSGTISKVDLTTFSVVQERPMITPVSQPLYTPLRIAAGVSNYLYHTDGGWGPSLSLFNFLTGSNASVYSDSDGTGDICISRDGQTLFRSSLVNGSSLTHVTRFAISNNALSPLEHSIDVTSDPNFVHMYLNEGETWIFDRDARFAATNVSVVLTRYSDQIFGISHDGRIALGPSQIFNGQTGQYVNYTPFDTFVQTISGDQKKWFGYDAYWGNLVVWDMSDLVADPLRAVNPVPANGTPANLPLANLSWTGSPSALDYDVYFGSDGASVFSADTNSPEYLGNTAAASVQITNTVLPGTTYYWRVDARGLTSVVKGGIWLFEGAIAQTSPQSLTFYGIAGAPTGVQSISISAPTNVTWLLYPDQPWLTLSQSNGTGSAVVQVQCQVTNLPPGVYANSINIIGSGLSYAVPVTAQLYGLEPAKMIVDPNRDYIYMLHAGDGSTNNAFVVFLNTTTGVMEKALPLGVVPTDIGLNHFEDRLYVSDGSNDSTPVIELPTQTLSSSATLGSNVYHVIGGRAGRLVTATADDPSTVSLINTSNWSLLDHTIENHGTPICDPGGSYLIYAETDTAGAQMVKYLIDSDRFDPIGSAAASDGSYWGSGNIVMSLDGSRIFWTGTMFDNGLDELLDLGSEIYACSTNGAIAISTQSVFETATGSVINWPYFPSGIMAVDRANSNLWYYDNNNHLQSVSLRQLQAPTIIREPSFYDTVDLGGQLIVSAEVIGQTPIYYQWQFNGTNIPGAIYPTLTLTNVQFSQIGTYQLVASNSFGNAVSASFGVPVADCAAITRQPWGGIAAVGDQIYLSVETACPEGVTYQWQRDGTNIPGEVFSQYNHFYTTLDDAGIYRVIVKGDSTTYVSSNAPVVVFTPLDLQADPADQAVVLGKSAQFHVQAAGAGTVHYQWSHNGTVLSGKTAATLAIPSVRRPDSGDYEVRISTDDDWTVDTATLWVLPPPPQILFPVENQRFTAPIATIRGIVNSKAEVYGLGYTCNDTFGGADFTAGATSWTIPNPSLQYGLNTVSVEADNSDGSSSNAIRHFYYTPVGQLNLTINGKGTVQRNFTGTNLQCGVNYTMTAVPGPNQIFAGWTGDAVASTKQLTFTMMPDLQLQANFETNLFLDHAGVYQGLFADTNEIPSVEAGPWTFTMRKDGTVSGKFNLGGNNFVFTGAFDSSGSGSFGPIHAGTRIISWMQLDLTNNSVTGYLSDGSWLASITGGRQATRTTLRTKNWPGKYTVTFPGSDDLSYPMGTGFASLRLTTAGNVTISGQLGDGWGFSQSGFLNEDGRFPFGVIHGLGLETALAWLDLGSNTNSTNSQLIWLRQSFHAPNGFSGFINRTSVPLLLSPFNARTTNLLGVSSGSMIVSDFAGTNSFSLPFTLSPKGVFNFPDATNGMSASISPATGILSGSFYEGRSIRVIRCVINQSQTNASGFFIDQGQSGRIEFQPDPE